MIKVSVEVKSGAARSRADVQAQSIRGSLSVAGARCPAGDDGAVFPIEPEVFFVRYAPLRQKRSRRSTRSSEPREKRAGGWIPKREEEPSKKRAREAAEAMARRTGRSQTKERT
jgi:hypothetical protein